MSDDRPARVEVIPCGLCGKPAAGFYYRYRSETTIGDWTYLCRRHLDDVTPTGRNSKVVFEMAYEEQRGNA